MSTKLLNLALALSVAIAAGCIRSPLMAHIVDKPPGEGDGGGGGVTPPPAPSPGPGVPPPAPPSGGGGGGGDAGPPGTGGGGPGEPGTGDAPADGDATGDDGSAEASTASHTRPTVPEIDRMTNAGAQAPALAGALNDMLQAIDPDLRAADGKRAGVRGLAQFHRQRLSDPDAVIAALDALKTGEIQSSAAEGSPEHARAVAARSALRTALEDLRDDVPSPVADAVFRDPRSVWWWWLAVAVLLAVGIAVGVRYLRTGERGAQRQAVRLR